jgi:hypothetical protein
MTNQHNLGDRLNKLREIVREGIKGEVPTDFLIDLLKALAYLLEALEEEDENEDDP